MNASSRPTLHRAEVERALAAQSAAADMMPRGDSVAGLPGELVPAAVLCPIVERPAGLRMLFTRRTEHLPRHAGQISFPGGRIEESDASPLAAALREAREEIGLAEHQVRPVGELARYRTGTGYEILPYVGFVAADFEPVPDRREVAEVFEAPLDFVLDPRNRHRERFVGSHGRAAWYDTVPYGEYHIWGATAAILRTLAECVGWSDE